VSLWLSAVFRQTGRIGPSGSSGTLGYTGDTALLSGAISSRPDQLSSRFGPDPVPFGA